MYYLRDICMSILMTASTLLFTPVLARVLKNECINHEGTADAYAGFYGIRLATGQTQIKVTVFHLILWKRHLFLPLFDLFS